MENTKFKTDVAPLIAKADKIRNSLKKVLEDIQNLSFEAGDYIEAVSTFVDPICDSMSQKIKEIASGSQGSVKQVKSELKSLSFEDLSGYVDENLDFDDEYDEDDFDSIEEVTPRRTQVKAPQSQIVKQNEPTDSLQERSLKGLYSSYKGESLREKSNGNRKLNFASLRDSGVIDTDPIALNGFTSSVSPSVPKDDYTDNDYDDYDGYDDYDEEFSSSNYYEEDGEGTSWNDLQDNLDDSVVDATEVDGDYDYGY